MDTSKIDPHVLMKAVMRNDNMTDDEKLKLLRKAIIKYDPEEARRNQILLEEE